MSIRVVIEVGISGGFVVKHAVPQPHIVAGKTYLVSKDSVVTLAELFQIMGVYPVSGQEYSITVETWA